MPHDARQLVTLLALASSLPACDAWLGTTPPRTSAAHTPIHAAATKVSDWVVSAALAATLSVGSLVAAPSDVAMAAEPPAAVSQSSPSQKYLFFTGFPFPLGPFTERKTVETELVKDRVYSFEQEIRLSGISANVRSTVFRTRDNHLVVYNPVAPTEEFVRQLDALGSKGVSHILLGATQYEHKVFVGPFARKFPEAHVWAVPGQWSWPLPLPAKYLGIDVEGTGGGDLVDTASHLGVYAAAPDLTDEFEVKLLEPRRRLGFGYAANEAALLHKDTKTLALTDALVNCAATPPKGVYDEALLRTIGDNAPEGVSIGNVILKAAGAVNWQGSGAQAVHDLFAMSDADARQGSVEAQLQRGWERNVLLSLFFGPAPEAIIDPDASFARLKDKWVVAPVTDALIYRSERVRPELARWVDDVASWDFEMIAPSHFRAAPGTPADFRRAFAPTLAAGRADASRPYAAADVRLLDDLADGLTKLKVI